MPMGKYNLGAVNLPRDIMELMKEAKSRGLYAGFNYDEFTFDSFREFLKKEIREYDEAHK